jgi:hypothetical protein
MISNLPLRDTLTATKIKAPQAPLSWRIRNGLRWGYIWGIIANALAHGLTAITGIPTITSELAVQVIRRDGRRINYGVVSRRVVTNNGVAYIVDAWQNSVELENMKYHGCGTGTTAEAAGDSALVTESTTALNPDSTRATGTQTELATHQLTSTGVVTFDNSAAITEHGLFSQAATGGGVLFDRSVFSAINVASGDSISFAYTVSFSSGS